MWFHFTPNVLVVSKDSEFKTLDDFIAFAKKKPFVAIDPNKSFLG
jgi:tripartite-type tricarboxylate transporter receptor subunit TctC